MEIVHLPEQRKSLEVVAASPMNDRHVAEGARYQLQGDLCCPPPARPVPLSRRRWQVEPRGPAPQTLLARSSTPPAPSRTRARDSSSVRPGLAELGAKRVVRGRYARGPGYRRPEECVPSTSRPFQQSRARRA